MPKKEMGDAMSYINPEDKKAWRKRYSPKQREQTKAWHKRQSQLKQPERDKRSAAIERRENARVLPIVIKQLMREAMFREGLARCTICKGVFARADIKISGANNGAKLSGECRPCHSKSVMASRKRNPEMCRRLWKLTNAKIKADPTLNLVRRIRQRTNKALVYAKTRMQQGVSSMAYIGCTRDQLRAYIESQFKPGMNWGNYGRIKGKKTWVVDHVFPVASFDLTTEAGMLKAFHYTNLTPLWDKENAKKNDTVPSGPHQPLLLYA